MLKDPPKKEGTMSGRKVFTQPSLLNSQTYVRWMG